MGVVNIVLVEPQIPQNTGNIARTCAVTGASLHIVKPMGFTIDDKKLKRAGLDYWHELDLHYYSSVQQLLSAFPESRFYFFTTKAKKEYTRVSYHPGDFIVFGREDKGLPESLLEEHYDHAVRIPMRETLRSLNLSNAVAIAAYEMLRQFDFPDLSFEGSLTSVGE